MQKDPSLPPEPLPLTEASVQEVQLELMRRTRFNAFEGPRVVASLRRHRKLGHAAGMDRSNWSLLKLRDLPRNYWNSDELFILTEMLEQARELNRIAEEEEWNADNITLVESEGERSRLLGEFPPRGYVISFWWD